jgi:hypothetical protein
MMGRSRACCLAVGFGLGFRASIAIAEKIPSPEALEQSGVRPVTLTVIEPHLSEPGHRVAMAYMAFPASAVLSAALGPDWTTKAKTIEFRARRLRFADRRRAAHKQEGLYGVRPR